MNHQENTATDEAPARLSLFIASLRFAFSNHRLPIILTGFFLLLVVMDWLSGWLVLDDLKTRWNTDLDQIVSLATLMIALFVWYGEIAEDWKNNLPKRLTVRFENDMNELVMLCIKAYLSDVADIRALGQQIARQMCENKDIHFRAPYVKRNAGEILYDSGIGYFLHYEVTFTLTSRPDGLLQRKHKLWKAPFSSGDLTIEDNSSC
jgi:hypothetical protein